MRDVRLGSPRPRRQLGVAIAAYTKITRKGARCGWWPSQSGRGRYTVPRPDDRAPHCTCPDHEETGQTVAKHIFAVQIVIRREQDPDGTETITEQVTITEASEEVRDRGEHSSGAHSEAGVRQGQHLLPRGIGRCAVRGDGRDGRASIPAESCCLASEFALRYSTAPSVYSPPGTLGPDLDGRSTGGVDLPP